jgi:hypothetical protein
VHKTGVNYLTAVTLQCVTNTSNITMC